MTLSPPTRRLLASCSLLSSLIALSCGGTSNPGTTHPDLPQATLQVEETNSVGKSIKLSISVSGCTKVQKMELLNNDTVLKPVTYTTTPTPVELLTSEISFVQGISANLSLTVRVTCDDGRTNVSQAQPATFLPVEEVIEPASASEQVVPDYFVVDGSGDSASFIGCGVEGTRSFLYRVRKSDPNHYDTLDMNFTCDGTTIITERKPAGSGTRWVWTPSKGAMAIDASFRSIGEATTGVKSLAQLAITPDGSALVSDGVTLQRVSQTKGTVLWTAQNDDISNGGNILGDPVVRKGSTPNTVVVAKEQQSLTDNSVDVRVAVFNYDDGTFQKTYPIAHVTPPQDLVGTFDVTGNVLYLSMQGASSALVEACAVGVSDLCKAGTTPKSRLWITDALLGTVVGLVPYNSGSRLAVLTTNRYWFLDIQNSSATLGKVVNKGQVPLTPNGSLVAHFAQPGLNDSSFYVFNGGSSASGPVEIIATDAAEKGLLYRYQTPGNSLYGALDDSGAMWLRVGRKLVKPLTLTQYRQLLP